MFFKVIGGVIIFCLIFLLIELKLILLVYLVVMKNKFVNFKNLLYCLCLGMDKGLKNFVDNYYILFIGCCIYYCYIVIVGFICVFIVSGGMFMGGLVKFVVNFKILYDFFCIFVEMNLLLFE